MKKIEELKTWEDGINQVICGDCIELIKKMPDKCVDLVLTDPPYGINYNNEKLNRKSSMKFEDIENDNKEIDYEKLIKELQRIGKRTIIFGAINFFKDLPHKGIWICWDKRTKEEADGALGSPFELAWCDKIGGYNKIYRIMHGGFVNADKGKRFHPTQKPVRLFSKIITDFSKESDLIFDPFMGSWTTARACKDLNRNFIGCELSEKYCQIGEERLRQEILI